MNDDIKKMWHDCLESIKVSVSPAIYNTWFSQTHITNLKQTEKRSLAEIGCPSSFIKSTVENRYYGLIQDTLSKTLNKPCDLVFIIKENPDKKTSILETPLFNIEKEGDDEIKASLLRTRLRANFTFDNFAVSSSNQMAWAAADAVSKNPGSAYNPLFIWGGVGVGKTHLMNSVGYYLISKNSENKNSVVFCTGEDFTNDIVEGIRNKTTQSFRNKYRKLELLMIDDIQFIAGKDAVQEEFFHTFNALVNSGSQIILTSDQPPSEISKLEERLRSRFEAGLIVDISPPDFELRCAIIQIKVKERGLEIESDMVQLIAGNIDSARKIEGFLTRLASEAKLKNSEVNIDLIEKLLGKGEADGNQVIKANPTDVVSAVSKYFSVGKRALLGTSRQKPIAHPRQILMYLLRTQLSLPLQEVGRIVGGRDHTTIMHGVDKITHSASANVQIREDIRGIKNLL
jgi:chromosomal replication initiator protein